MVNFDSPGMRYRWQQYNVLRALLHEGRSPHEIKEEFVTDWTIDEIRAIRTAEEMTHE